MTMFLYSSRGLLGEAARSALEHFKILETKSRDITLLDYTNSNAKKISQEALLPLRGSKKISNFYEETKTHYNLWSDFYNNVDVSFMKHAKILCIVGGIDLHRSNLTRISNRKEVFPKDSGQLRFVSAGKVCANILALLKAHHIFHIPLVEIAVDPNELSCNSFAKEFLPYEDLYFLYHGYDIERYSMKRLDSLQYYYNQTNNIFRQEEKCIDMTFGYTAYPNSKRMNYEKDIQQLKYNFKNSHIKRYGHKEKRLDKSIYLNLIEKSKYTYILPAYDESCFSIYRFVESLYHDCLPLLHEKCKVQEVEKSFSVSLSDLFRTTPFTESKRKDLLQYYREKFLDNTLDKFPSLCYNESFASVSPLTSNQVKE